jgi:hypothetical protein
VWVNLKIEGGLGDEKVDAWANAIYFLLGWRDPSGPFAIKGNHLYAKGRLVGTLAKNVAIIKTDGSAVNSKSLQFARVVEIKKNSAGNIIQIRILSWEY